MRKGTFMRVVAVLLVVSVGWLASGCFGKFQLTRKVYDINKSVEDKYLRSAVTWLFVIIPVYGIAALLDFILFNVIEFWSGENPITSAPVTKVYAKGHDKAVMTIARVDGATVATVERYKADRLVSTLTVRDDGKGLVTADLREGAVAKRIAALARPDGSVEVSAGSEKTVYAASAVTTAMARVARAAAGGGAWIAGAPAAAPLAASPRLPAFQG